MPTVLKDIHGPDWPAGWIVVVVGGTPVRLTSLIDPANLNAPETPSAVGALEYTPRYNQLIFQGYTHNKFGVIVPNSGNVYIVRKGGSRADYGTIVAVVAPGETLVFKAPATVQNVFSLYRYWVDADWDIDGVFVTGLIF